MTRAWSIQTNFLLWKSQGAVLGGGYTAMHGQMDGVILGVGGAPFSLLLNRAQGFTPFLLILETMYDNWMDITLIQALYQQLWTHGKHWMDSPATESCVDASCNRRRQCSDHRSCTGTGFQCPYAACKQNGFGLEPVNPPFSGSAYIEWDYGIEDSLGPYPP